MKRRSSWLLNLADGVREHSSILGAFGVRTLIESFVVSHMGMHLRSASERRSIIALIIGTYF
jgi:hypothetical protein